MHENTNHKVLYLLSIQDLACVYDGVLICIGKMCPSSGSRGGVRRGWGRSYPFIATPSIVSVPHVHVEKRGVSMYTATYRSMHAKYNSCTCR